MSYYSSIRFATITLGHPKLFPVLNYPVASCIPGSPLPAQPCQVVPRDYVHFSQPQHSRSIRSIVYIHLIQPSLPVSPILPTYTKGIARH